MSTATRLHRVAEPGPVHARQRLAHLVEFGGDLLELADELIPDPAGRDWKRLFVDDTADAWLIAWGAESYVDAHDHGASCGALHVLRGTLTESYRTGTARRKWRVRDIGSGRSVAVPRDRIHEVANLAPTPAVSVHVYSPPLTQMTFQS